MNGHNADNRFGRDRRLQNSRCFRDAFDQGDSTAGRYLVLWTRKADDSTLRLGVIASKKTFPRAVDRNKAKRMLREAFRLNRQYISQAKVDFVIVARRAILRAALVEIGEELLGIVKSKGLEVITAK